MSSARLVALPCCALPWAQLPDRSAQSGAEEDSEAYSARGVEESEAPSARGHGESESHLARGENESEAQLADRIALAGGEEESETPSARDIKELHRFLGRAALSARGQEECEAHSTRVDDLSEAHPACGDEASSSKAHSWPPLDRRPSLEKAAQRALDWPAPRACQAGRPTMARKKLEALRIRWSPSAAPSTSEVSVATDSEEEEETFFPESSKLYSGIKRARAALTRDSTRKMTELQVQVKELSAKLDSSASMLCDLRGAADAARCELVEVRAAQDAHGAKLDALGAKLDAMARMLARAAEAHDGRQEHSGHGPEAAPTEPHVDAILRPLSVQIDTLADDHASLMQAIGELPYLVAGELVYVMDDPGYRKLYEMGRAPVQVNQDK